MNNDTRQFEQLQRWMQAVITHPLGIEAGIQSDDACAHLAVPGAKLESVVTRSLARTSIERLEVYGNAYFSRLLECLREQFPVLAHALTTAVFDRFALDYLRAYPPRSYTLNDLADRFIPFLRETRPERASAAQPDWADFVVDLARMEEAIDAVFDGPGLERESPISADALRAIPASAWPRCRLAPSPALRLLSFEFPVNDYYTAFRAGASPEIPPPQTSWLAMHRRDYIVRRLAISQPQFALLSAIVAGEAVGDAIAAAAELIEDGDRFADELRGWFFDWLAAGFFRGLASENRV